MTQKGLKTVSRKTPGMGRRALLCVLLGALIIALSFCLRKRLGLPLPFSVSPRSGAPRQQDGARTTREISLAAHSLYALQLGAFTQEGAARQLAQEFSARGAAGYVHFDGSAYRVLAAAYPTRAEAQSVQTRLGAQSISTYIHPCVQEALTLQAGGTLRQLQAVEDALAYLSSLGDKLYALSAALDARDMEAAAARQALLSEGATSAALLDGLGSAFEGSVPGSLLPLCDTLERVADTGEAQRNEKSAARTGAALKRCHLTVFFGLLAFAQGLS